MPPKVIRTNNKTCHVGLEWAAGPPRGIGTLRVAAVPGVTGRGRLCAGGVWVACALGPGGVSNRKREGDGTTPAGRFKLKYLFFRSDKAPRPATAIRVRATRPRDLWCDDPGHRLYNRRTVLPAAARHENLWRADDVYDIVIVLDFNLRQRVLGRGSAVFFHLARPGFTPTAGCVAITRADMRRLLPRLSSNCVMIIR